MNRDDMTQEPSFAQKYAALASWLALLSQVLEASIVVFLRRGFGRRYFGAQAAAVIPVVLVYAILWQEHDPTSMMVFLGLYLVAVLWAGICTAWRCWRKRDVEHSHYSGMPSIMRWRICCGWLKETTAKGVVEPTCVVIIGAVFMPYYEPLGTYLIIAAVGLMISVRLAMAYEQERLLDIRDAYHEQRHVVDRFRDKDWF